MINEQSEPGGWRVGDGLAQFAQYFLFPKERSEKDKFRGVSPETKSGLKLLRALKSSFIGISVPPGQMGSQHVMTFKAIESFLKRLEHVVSRRVISDMVQSDENVHILDVEHMLPPKMKALGHCVVAWRSVQESRKLVEAAENDWDFLVKNTSLFETFSLAATDPIMEDTVLEGIKGASQDYVNSFLQAAKRHLDMFGGGLMDELKSFQTRYNKVAECAEGWEMAPVESLFEITNEENIMHDLTALEATCQSVVKVCSSMTGLLNHTSSNKEYMDFMDELKKQQATALSLLKECKISAGCLIMSDLFLGRGGKVPDKLEFEAALKRLEESYSFTKGDLPGKLQKMVSDVLSDLPKGRKRERKPRAGADNADEEKPTKAAKGSQAPSSKPKREKKEKEPEPKKVAKKAKK